MAKEARHRGHVRAVRDEQAGIGVPQGVDVQILRQAVLFQDQLEPLLQPAAQESVSHAHSWRYSLSRDSISREK